MTTTPPHEPSEAAVEAARDIVDRLKDHCTGHPDARIPWPHRVLHDAIAEIERLRRSASACPAVSVETLRRFGYAPGGYLCACKDCRHSYMADKKSWRCLACAAAAAETAPATPPAGTVPVLAGVGRDEDGKLMVYGGTNMTKDEIVDWFASCDYYDPHAYLTAMVPPEPIVPEFAAKVEKPDA